jgi:hypothetical protein
MPCGLPGRRRAARPHLGERRFAVEEILDRWLDPRHRYFKVKVDDGRRFIVRHDSASGEWKLAALVHV